MRTPRLARGRRRSALGTHRLARGRRRGALESHRLAVGALIGLALLIALTVGSALAGPPTDSLKQHVDEVVKLLSSPALKNKSADRHAAVRKVAEDIFDYPETARRALGAHWNERTPQEKQEFTALFADLLDRAYISKIDLYQGEKVTYLGESADGDEATVKTKIVTKSGTDVPIDYRMHRKSGRWLVCDVIIEGVSLVANYRTQFNKVIRTESYPALVQKLKSKDTQPAASPGRPAR